MKSDLIAASRASLGCQDRVTRRESRIVSLLLSSKQRVIIPFLFFLFSLSVASFRCAPCTVLLQLLLLLLLRRRLCSDFLRSSQLQVSAPHGTEAQPASVTLPSRPSHRSMRESGGARAHIHTRALKGTPVGVVQPNPPDVFGFFFLSHVLLKTVRNFTRLL